MPGLAVDFLATPTTLLPVCQPVAAVTEINTTIIASQGVWECSGKSRIVPRMNSRCLEGVQ